MEKFLSDDHFILFEFTVQISSNTMLQKLNCLDLESGCGQECTDFLKACHEGDEAKVENMMNNSKDVQKNINMTAKSGMNGFMIACRQGHVDIVSLFLKKATDFKLNVNAKDSKKEQTGLTLAVIEGDLKIVKLLTQEKSIGIDLNATDIDAKTPFMHACQNGFKDIVAHFLKLAESRKPKELNLNASDDNGNTAFHHACQAEQHAVMELIGKSAVRLKIRLDLKNKEGNLGYKLWGQRRWLQGLSHEPLTDSSSPTPVPSESPATSIIVSQFDLLPAAPPSDLENARQFDDENNIIEWMTPREISSASSSSSSSTTSSAPSQIELDDLRYVSTLTRRSWDFPARDLELRLEDNWPIDEMLLDRMDNRNQRQESERRLSRQADDDRQQTPRGNRRSNWRGYRGSNRRGNRRGRRGQRRDDEQGEQGGLGHQQRI